MVFTNKLYLLQEVIVNNTLHLDLLLDCLLFEIALFETIFETILFVNASF